MLTDDTAANLGVLENAYRHGFSGGGGLLRIIEHAAIWSVVRRIIDALPLGVVVLAGACVLVVASVGYLRRGRRRVE